LSDCGCGMRSSRHVAANSLRKTVASAPGLRSSAARQARAEQPGKCPAATSAKGNCEVRGGHGEGVGTELREADRNTERGAASLSSADGPGRPLAPALVKPCAPEEEPAMLPNSAGADAGAGVNQGQALLDAAAAQEEAAAQAQTVAQEQAAAHEQAGAHQPLPENDTWAERPQQEHACRTVVPSYGSSGLESASDDNRGEVGRPSAKLMKQKTNKKLSGAIGQFREDDMNSAVMERAQEPWTLKRFVTSFHFDVTFAILILMNTCVMAAEVQYKGFDNAVFVGHLGETTAAKDKWPNAPTYFAVLEYLFGIIFTFEVGIKILGLRKAFLKTPWNWFDSVIVAFWLVDKLVNATLIMNPMILRLLRLLRLVRLARMVKTIQAFDSLQVLIGSIIASASVLLWASIILVLLTSMVALFLNSMLEDYILDESEPLLQRQQVFAYFGTFTRALLTMFELTLSNWIPCCRLLMDHVDEWYAMLILTYKLTMGFAVVKVITGVFLHETFKVASTDDELMVVQKQRATAKHTQQMMKLFKEADISGDGTVGREEWKNALRKSKVKTWLSAMDLEVGDADLLFDFLDNGDDSITAEELINGVARLKGSARSIDVVALMYKCMSIERSVEELTLKTAGQEMTISVGGDK